MKMKKLVIGATLGAVLTFGSLSSAVFAEDTTGSKTTNWTDLQKQGTSAKEVWMSEKQAEKTARIEAKAEKFGISVDELQAKINAKKAEAKAQGITVKELVANQKQAKLQERADKLGISVEELKAKRDAIKAEANAQGISVKELISNWKAELQAQN